MDEEDEKENNLDVVYKISKLNSPEFSKTGNSLLKLNLEVPNIKLNISEIMIPINTSLCESITNFNSAISPLLHEIPLINEKNIAFFERLEKLNFSFKEADQILTNYNWTVSHSLPPLLAVEIFEIHKNDKIQNKDEEINKLFVSYFQENNYSNLIEMVNGWKNNPLFKRRMNIFQDCIWALMHEDSPYNSSNLIIPTLITQIDGISLDYLESRGYHFDNSNKRWYNNNGKQKNEQDCKKEGICDSNLFIESYTNLFLKKLFEKAYRGQTTTLVLNRHKILHGEYIDFGTIDNTIRVFLVLDLLSELS